MATEDDTLLPKQGIERLTQALQDSRGRTEQQLARLEQKLDQLSRDLVSAESEIRKELQTQFVTKLEYEPRHRILEEQIANLGTMLTRHMVDADTHWREQAVMGVEIDQLQEDYKDVDDRQRGATQRSLPWIAVVVSLLSVVYQILQHIQFH